MEKFLQLVAIMGLSLGSFILRLVVLTKVWALVAVPLGAPHLDFIHAYGLMLICNLTQDYKPTKSDGELSTALANIITSIIGSLLVWGVAYWIFG